MSNQNAFAESGNSPPRSRQVALTVRERRELIRAAKPYRSSLENLFEMQNRICDLCGHPIENFICAVLEHSTPIIYFARLAIPLEEAIAQAHDPKNLRCAHASCNGAKRDMTREEWYRRGLNNRDQPQPLTEGQLLELQFRLGEGGRRSKALGLGIFAPGMSAKGGHRVHELHPEMAVANGRARGRSEAGRKHMAAVGRARAGVVGGSPGTPEGRAKGGRITGLKMKKEKRGIYAPGMAAIAGHLSGANHARWHVARGLSNPTCARCNPIDPQGLA